MTTLKSCSIKLLNQTYGVKCPEPETANLQLAAEKINNQLLLNRKNFKQLDDFQNLVLAALHISRELVLCQNQQEQQRNQMAQFINSLENKSKKVTKNSATLDSQTK